MVSLLDQGGNDVFLGSTLGTTFWLGQGNDVLIGSTGDDSYFVQGSDFGHDRIVDKGGDNFIRFGDALEHYLFARAGNDLIIATGANGSSVVIQSFYNGAQASDSFVFNGKAVNFTDIEHDGHWVAPSVVAAVYTATPDASAWL